MTREQGIQIAAFLDDTIESGQLAINDTIVWFRREGHLKARVAVFYPDDSGFRMELLQVPLLPKRFSIQLMYKGRTVRRYCSVTPHMQPRDCEHAPAKRIVGKHKHRWSDETGDECVYVPDDINGSLIEEAFYEFCAESGVSFLGVWRDPPATQMPLDVVR